MRQVSKQLKALDISNNSPDDEHQTQPKSEIETLIGTIRDRVNAALDKLSEVKESLQSEDDDSNKIVKKVDRSTKKLDGARSELKALKKIVVDQQSVIRSEIQSKEYVSNIIDLKSTSKVLRSVNDSLSQSKSSSDSSLFSIISEHNSKVSKFNNKYKLKDILKRIVQADLAIKVFSETKRYYKSFSSIETSVVNTSNWVSRSGNARGALYPRDCEEICLLFDKYGGLQQ